ncbi:TPA: hypothetical protein DEP58_03105 [Patescibacteria group bacterium]|nr:MAG: hypothetical protein UU98_C0018G0030 [Parcubacteria group bacterium GW2011_GWD2_42_14]HCC05270.1 hypothetical protein [Patescibacteria group bacterium]
MNNIETVVMARVRRIHSLRRFMHPTMMKVYSGFLLFGTLGSMVSIANVLANMPSVTSPAQVVSFTLNAVVHTEMFVQFVVVGIGVVCALLIRDILQNLKQKSVFTHA